MCIYRECVTTSEVAQLLLHCVVIVFEVKVRACHVTLVSVPSRFARAKFSTRAFPMPAAISIVNAGADAVGFFLKISVAGAWVLCGCS